jgi:prolyl-tRNA synthetase
VKLLFVNIGWVHRDLPLLINQWANVVRWEDENAIVFENSRVFMARRAYCSCNKSRRLEESEKMMNVYADFAENFMAIPVVKVLNRNGAFC